MVEEFKGDKVLTKAIAEQFLEDPESVDLSEFTAIEDEAAEILCRTEETELILSGLTRLSDAAAESLAKHQGYLSLNGLTSLSDAAAESLGKHQGDLWLKGLTSLSDAAAESLGQHQGTLLLSGLTSLSDAAAESLGKHQGFLVLDGLTSLSDAAAESLGKQQGDLSLDGLTSLSDAAAESLGKHQGDLWLDGLTSLSDAAAESLGKHQGDLTLNGLTSLSDRAAIFLKSNMSVLTQLQAEQYIADESNVDLDQFKLVSDEAAEVLSHHTGVLCLENVRAISGLALKNLLSHKGSIELPKLNCLSLTDACHLAEYKGGLVLELKNFDEGTRMELSRHPSLRFAGPGGYGGGELEKWILNGMGFNRDENLFKDWLGWEMRESLMEIADCSHWVDRSDDARGYGTSLEGVISVVRNAGRQLIHLVKLWDEGETCLLFVGEIEEIKAKLSPLLNSLKNQNHEDNDLEFDDDE